MTRRKLPKCETCWAPLGTEPGPAHADPADCFGVLRARLAVVRSALLMPAADLSAIIRTAMAARRRPGAGPRTRAEALFIMDLRAAAESLDRAASEIELAQMEATEEQAAGELKLGSGSPFIGARLSYAGRPDTEELRDWLEARDGRTDGGHDE